MKTLKSLFLALTITLTMTASRPSQAAIGAIFSPALVTAGVVMLKVGGVGIGASVIYIVAGPNKWTGSKLENAAMTAGLLGWVSAFLGLVVLDDEQTVAYSPLHLDEAKKIGLSEVELANFNAEVDQVNALAAFVDSELANMEKPTQRDSAELWLEVKDTLSPEAFSALIKITNQIYK